MLQAHPTQTIAQHETDTFTVLRPHPLITRKVHVGTVDVPRYTDQTADARRLTRDEQLTRAVVEAVRQDDGTVESLVDGKTFYVVDGDEHVPVTFRGNGTGNDPTAEVA